MANVLLLEPDAYLGNVYKKCLSDHGYIVTHCKEASQAISSLDTSDIDLVILEVQIALHNGIEFLYELRSYPDWQNIPVIINSVIPKQILEQNKLLQKQLSIAEILYKPTTKLHMLLSSVKRNVPAIRTVV